MHVLIRESALLKGIEINPDEPIFCDTETCIHEGYTDGGLYGKVRLVQIHQASWNGTAAIIDCFFVPLDEILEILKPHHLVFHNASYDLHTINLHTEEEWLPRKISDTLYLSRLTFFTKFRFGFYQCLKYAGLEDETIQDIDKKANQKFKWDGPLNKRVLKYAECDVTYLGQLYPMVKDAESTESYKLDMLNLRYAIRYDRRGIPVNQDKVKQRLLDCTNELEDVLQQVPVNPGSSKQCCNLLNTSNSDRDTLMKLFLEGNEMAGKIREARLLLKERMYLMKYNRPLIYGFHSACGAISGRMSCDGGHRFDHSNIQQIPRRLLPCLEAPEGYIFVYKDYSGLELRMAVVWTGEPTMERLMRKGVDLHSYTGSIIYNKPQEELSKYERMIGKILNFTLVYGAGPVVVQSMLRAWGNVLVPMAEVKELRSRWLEEYHYFKEWHDMHAKQIKVYGYLDVSTALGRKVRTFTVPDSLNTPIQGSSAECTKVSLKYLYERHESENLVNTIHDSNALLVPEDKKWIWIKRLNECMVEAWEYVIKDLAIPDMPMPAEAEANKIWEF